MIVKISLSGKSFKGLSDYLRHDVKADTENRGVDPSGSGVLQTSQKWPEIAGSKWRGFAKPGERFQRLSPKAVVLPTSVCEIGRQVRESSRIAGSAVTQAEQTDARIAKLSHAAQ